MKWMKWIGRSLVERAAAAALPDLRRRCIQRINKISAQLFAGIEHPKLTGSQQHSSTFLNKRLFRRGRRHQHASRATGVWHKGATTFVFIRAYSWLKSADGCG
jgi:hypothetical protein